MNKEYMTTMQRFVELEASILSEMCKENPMILFLCKEELTEFAARLADALFEKQEV